MFEFLKRKTNPVVESEMNVAGANVENAQAERPTIERCDFVDDTDPVASPGAMPSMLSLKTGMPIDKIYEFLHQNYEQIGYDDAMINQSKEYRESKESIICHELKTLFSQVKMGYNSFLRQVDVRIKNAEDSFVFSAVEVLQAKKATCEEHLSTLVQMESDFDRKEPNMLTMVESYRRGFAKGIMARVSNF